MNHLSIQKACEIARRDLLAELERRRDHEPVRQPTHWTGELSASALSTATAISALSLFLKNADKNAKSPWMMGQLEKSVQWLASQQNDDGGWGDTNKSHSNISTTMLAIAALTLAGKQLEYSSKIKAANRFVESKGGIDGLRKRYGKDKTFAVPILANCAIAGIAEWKEVSPLPFEFACVPQRFYRFVRMPVVSYAIPALVAIGQAKFFADPPRNPVTRLLRKGSIGKSLQVLNQMQPESGGYLEAIPLTCFVAMALIDSGRWDHPVVQNAMKFVESSYRQEGSWPIDTNLATWVTTLSINALLASDADLETENDSIVAKCDLDWILKCQYQEVHPFTGAAPGGWGWSDLSGAVPDADDTPGALLAIRKFYERKNCSSAEREKILKAAEAGVNWLLDLQNRDRGWPTFCKGWGRLPFDRSGTDLTAHVLRALHAWKKEIGSPRIDRAIGTGLDYLVKTQDRAGFWNPLWFGNQDNANESNPIYGTSKVLMSLVELGETDTSTFQRGLEWMIESQNDDGGWGGGTSLASSRFECNQVNSSSAIELLGKSSVEETALAVEVLIATYSSLRYEAKALTVERFEKAIGNGLNWLKIAVFADFHRESWPIGFYFAKLWYHERLYPLIFTAAALTRAVGLETEIRSKLERLYEIPSNTEPANS